ncbi:MAG: methyl-accepting chemotaxis protein [Clostridia bacterium]|nr:methyl-accepting chemotaxis protein [Clostridia bacterium]
MRWFNNLKISTKLISAFVAVALISGVVGAVGIFYINQIKDASESIYINNTRPLPQMKNVAVEFQKIRVNILYTIMQEGDRSTYIDQIKESDAIINNSMTEYEKTISEEEKQEFKNLKGYLEKYKNFREQLISLALQGRRAEAFDIMLKELFPLAQLIYPSYNSLFDYNVKAADKKTNENHNRSMAATTTMIAFILAGMGFAIGLGIFISRAVSRPVKDLVHAAQSVAKGNLDIELEIKGKDEIAVLAGDFMKMVESMNEVLANINSAAQQVASGSKQVSDSAMALSQGATEQASSIQQLTASLEEISSQTKQNAENAAQANSLAESAKVNAASGNSQMKEMLKAMDEINSASANISKIIKVIDEIAFQTNILALNAAVEAARAGQHGKGFAVVAEEVRNLAARSANAAKETTAMIEGSINKVEEGTKMANQTAAALDSIVEGVTKVAALVGEIAVASNEQAMGISQINQGIMQVSDVVQTNSATSEESAAASEELASQAELLKEQVLRFKLRKSAGSEVFSRRPDKINGDVLRTLEHMKEGKTEGHKRIILSDNEFGKY